MAVSNYGRQVIYTDVTEIKADNVGEVLADALKTHSTNSADILYLYNYYKGKQPILEREKLVRPEINNTIVENRAKQIVQFKDGYLIGEPVQYVLNNTATDMGNDVLTLNRCMHSAGKEKCDTDLVHWMHICGTSYRAILPISDESGTATGASGTSGSATTKSATTTQASAITDDNLKPMSPFEVYSLNPEYTFVVYSRELGNPPVMAVSYIEHEDNTVTYTAYTHDSVYVLTGSGGGEPAVESTSPNPMPNGLLPIIEYPANEERLGSFEQVLGLLDAINNIDSNRLDGIEQIVQSLLVFKNVDIPDDMFDDLREKGCVIIGPDGDVKYIAQELNQQQTQTLKEDLWQAVLEIVGLPNRNGGASTSDTGTAVIFRDGWSAADGNAKSEEMAFKWPELKYFIPAAIGLCNALGDGISLGIKPEDLQVQFTRRNYENISGKSSVLLSMLGSDKISPRLAFEYCGMFSDPELAYEQSLEYMQSAQQTELDSVNAEMTSGKPMTDNTDGNTGTSADAE